MDGFGTHPNLTIRPRDTATRAQLATVIHRYLRLQPFSPNHDFWLQTDSRWADMPYGSNTRGNTFREAVCGLFAVKNALYAIGVDISL